MHLRGVRDEAVDSSCLDRRLFELRPAQSYTPSALHVLPNATPGSPSAISHRPLKLKSSPGATAESSVFWPTSTTMSPPFGGLMNVSMPCFRVTRESRSPGIWNVVRNVMLSRAIRTFVESGSGTGVRNSFEERWISRLYSRYWPLVGS